MALSSKGTLACMARTSRRRVFHRTSSSHRQRICEGYYAVHLESSTSRRPAGSQEVLTAQQGSQVTVPTMMFGGAKKPHFTSSHNDPLVAEMKAASAIVRRILIDTGSTVDIITWDCLKKLKYPGRDIVLLTGAKNLEVDFLVADAPTAYNVILGRPTLHKVKAVIASYLLQLQFEAHDRSVDKLQRDQRAARECYLVGIRPRVERSAEQGSVGPPPSDKRPRTALPNPAEALAENKKKGQEAIGGSYTSNVRILIIINVSMRFVLMAFTIRSRSPTIKKRGLLVTQVAVVSCQRNEIHQLKISSLGLGLTKILRVLNVWLEVALLAKSIRSQDHQEFPKELRTILMAQPVALLLGLSRFLSSRCGLSLRFRTGLF
ncbi:hypothetical protein Cgig2_003398 [Carnegiea gigantea]|uniref:Uncharacterized protein n=1 Tax=Carnegiea gigantea TaxID=171969 RepID=A0A9Q1Q4U9_9CARY|nr:hypothetical protein Cgig2_003398 [Carnegiea gigantea]